MSVRYKIDTYLGLQWITSFIHAILIRVIPNDLNECTCNIVSFDQYLGLSRTRYKQASKRLLEYGQNG